MFKLTNDNHNGRPIYSDGKTKAIAMGAIFKGTNASVVKRDLYISTIGETKGMYFIVPNGSKLCGSNFVETVNVAR